MFLLISNIKKSCTSLINATFSLLVGDHFNWSIYQQWLQTVPSHPLSNHGPDSAFKQNSRSPTFKTRENKALWWIQGGMSECQSSKQRQVKREFFLIVKETSHLKEHYFKLELSLKYKTLTTLSISWSKCFKFK